MSNNNHSFIEVQFPVYEISKESYKEKKSGNGQTLTGLGKWWGRKPLILVRAVILGLLMPAGENSQKDREIFLKILTMDDSGLCKRRNKLVSPGTCYEYLTPEEQKKYFSDTEQLIYKSDISRQERQKLQQTVFNRLSYDEKLKYCKRPEEVELTEPSEWDEINKHLGTCATDLQTLIQELGEKKIGDMPVVGDCFSGGGSIPFEASRMGCDVYCSDLNPVAMLLTWSVLGINGNHKSDIRKLKSFQDRIFEKADKQILKWEIEQDEKSQRAIYYLYCSETRCPECGFKVPLSPSWIIGKQTNTIAILQENHSTGFDIHIQANASAGEVTLAREMATIRKGNLFCPHCHTVTPVTAIRNGSQDEGEASGLRQWKNNDIISRKEDIFQERLYCIRYETGDENIRRYDATPTSEDIQREYRVLNLLKERFPIWQENGYLPTTPIEPGHNTSQIIREKGWRYWHHLFNPRQLLIHGLLAELIDAEAGTKSEKVVGILGLNRCVDWNSRLSRWDPTGSGGAGKGAQTYYNQALNTICNYVTRSLAGLRKSWFFKISHYKTYTSKIIKLMDARQIHDRACMWITDPPYADAVYYHELSEFFLAWDKKMLSRIFPDWYMESKRELAVQGMGELFHQTLAEIYQNLAQHMPENGMQVIMFTHHDLKIWAELTTILWSAGLQVTAAWNISTEPEAIGLKQGNYIKSTVILVLRKQLEDKTAHLDELHTALAQEVRCQMESMKGIKAPNFSEADYLLAAYAASIKVLTAYRAMEDMDISRIEGIIGNAVEIVQTYLSENESHES